MVIPILKQIQISSHTILQGHQLPILLHKIIQELMLMGCLLRISEIMLKILMEMAIKEGIMVSRII